MRKKFWVFLLILVAIIMLGVVGAYTLFMPQYQQIEINGYVLEVPASEDNVTNVNDNYRTYSDNEHNLTIKSYAETI